MKPDQPLNCSLNDTHLLQDSSDGFRTNETALVVIDGSAEGVDLKIYDKTKSVQLAHVTLELYNGELNVQFWNQKQISSGESGQVECLVYYDTRNEEDDDA